MFLTKYKLSTEKVISFINEKFNKDIYIPIHLDSIIVEHFDEYDKSFEIETWEACMIILLNENDHINNYLNKMKNNNEKPGLIIYPPSFDI